MIGRITKEPRLFILIVLLVLRGLFAVYVANTNIQAISLQPAAYDKALFMFYYVVLTEAILLFMASAWIAFYNRAGLYLGVLFILFDLISTPALFKNSPGTPNWIGLTFSLAALYGLYRFLTREPEKTLFRKSKP